MLRIDRDRIRLTDIEHSRVACREGWIGTALELVAGAAQVLIRQIIILPGETDGAGVVDRANERRGNDQRGQRYDIGISGNIASRIGADAIPGLYIEWQVVQTNSRSTDDGGIYLLPIGTATGRIDRR